MRFILLFLCLFTYLLSNAQVKSITASVNDAAGNPLMGNLLLTDTAGKTIRNTSFLGSISISLLNHSHLKLKLSSLLFADTTINLNYQGSTELNLGNIVPKESHTVLDQVTIRSAAPLMRYGNSSNLEVNVAGTILASSSSVTEILSRTPGVTVTEGAISLQGKGEAIIYLNGTLVSGERLNSIPTSQITKIEIISNPSARYDAAGRAVIHITTKTPNQNGISGRISQHLTAADFLGFNANTFTDLGYTQKKLSLFANLALLKGSGRELLYTTRVRPEATDYLNSELTTDWKRSFDPYLTYGLGARYSFTPLSVLSFSYSGNRDQLGGTVESHNIIQTAVGNNTYNSQIAKNELRSNHALIMDYSRITDTLGSNYFISTQYAGYGTVTDDRITENTGTTSGRYLQNNLDQNLHISSIQADRTKIWSKSTKLEAGLRFSSVSNQSATDFLSSSQPDGPFQIDNDLSSAFRYNETITAGYTSFSTMAGKLSVNIGARVEWTSYKLNTTARNAGNIGSSYVDFFPNLQLEIPAGITRLRASYSSRITRPRYQTLNPFVIYQDAFTTIEGNPNLKPERSHAIELSANMNTTELKLGYTYTTDQLSGAALRGNTPESYVLKSINISADHAFVLSLTRPISIGNWWQSINTASVSYGKSIDNQYGYITGKTKPQIYLYTNNTFSLQYGIKLQLLAWYLADRYYSLRHEIKRSTVTAGIEKSLLNNNLKISFTANDIFNRSASAGNYNVGNTQIYYERSYSNNYYRLMAIYRFGGSDKQRGQQRQAIQPENSRAN